MDRANHALAVYLARHGHQVHLVAHRAAADLLAQPTVHWHRVAKLAGSYFLGGFLLDRRGRQHAAALARKGGRVLVNGGNCSWADVNWVHYVHAAYPPAARRGNACWHQRLRHRIHARQERSAIGRARLVFANSERTRRDVIDQLGVASEKVKVVYYGTDPGQFHPPTAEGRATARAARDWPARLPVVTFIGALGDRRKGFDTLFAAWKILCGRPGWDGLLVVVGSGAELPVWQQLAQEAGLAGRIQFLGFRSDVPVILAASDVLVSPTRYEAYGLGVHEALCCGLPAIVTEVAGVAERYPAELRDLLLPDPEKASDLAERLRHCLDRLDNYRQRTATFAEILRARTWEHMAADIVRLVEENSA
jgi:glycosyltransferase involved in cell wall biosynthesis